MRTTTDFYTCDWCGAKRDADHGSTECYYTSEPFPDDWYRVNGGHLCGPCGSRRKRELASAVAEIEARGRSVPQQGKER